MKTLQIDCIFLVKEKNTGPAPKAMAKKFFLAELGFGENELLPLNHWSSGIGAEN